MTGFRKNSNRRRERNAIIRPDNHVVVHWQISPKRDEWSSWWNKGDQVWGMGDGRTRRPQRWWWYRVCVAVNIVQVTIELHKTLCRMSCYRDTSWSLVVSVWYSYHLRIVDSVYWMFKNVVWAQHMWFRWEWSEWATVCPVFFPVLCSTCSAFLCVSASTTGVKGDVFPCDKQAHKVTSTLWKTALNWHFSHLLPEGLYVPMFLIFFQCIPQFQ